MSVALGMRSLLAVSLGLHLIVAAALILGEQAGWFSPVPRQAAAGVVVVALVYRTEEPPAQPPTARAEAALALRPGGDSVVLAAFEQSSAPAALRPHAEQRPVRASADSALFVPAEDEPFVLTATATHPANLARATTDSGRPPIVPVGDVAAIVPPTAETIGGLASGEASGPPLIGVDEPLPVSEANTASAGEAPLADELAILRNPAPRYPSRARRRGLEGRIVIEVEVLESGAPGRLWVMTSSGHGVLDRAALAAVRQWAFRPPLRDGRPARAVMRVPILFRLAD